MPEGLFGGVPDGGRTGRHWSVLPLSIVAHGVGTAAVIVIPLAADAERPVPHRAPPAYVVVTSTPPAYVPPARGTSRVAPAPVTAPGVIAPPRETAEAADPGSGTDAGSAPPGIPEGAIGGFGPIGEVVSSGPPALPDPPAPPQRRPVPVGGAVSAPRKVLDVAPEYPALARSARVEGTVILEAVINERGVIERLKVLRSVPLLDAAALEAVGKWRYSPTLLNNVPVPVLMTITVTFSLRD